LASAALMHFAVEGRTQSSNATQGALRPDVLLVAKEAFDFNGIDQSMNLGRPTILNLAAGDFTVHAWVKFTSLTGGGPCHADDGCDRSIVDKMTSTNNDPPNTDGWRLLKQSGNDFWFCLGGGSENGCESFLPTTVLSQTVVEPGVWYSVAGVKTSTSISIYVNGVLEATRSFVAFTDTNTGNLVIGSHPPEGAFLAGLVGQVELFRRALSGAQVRAIFERSKARYRE